MSAQWIHSHVCTVPAAPERVFTALTDPRELRRWFAEDAEVEPRAGGPFRFWGCHTYGTPHQSGAEQKLTRWESPRALAFAWRMDGVDSKVHLELAPADDQQHPTSTKITLEHRFATKPADVELVDDLWRLTMGNLDAYLRGGAGVVLPDFTDPNPEVRVAILIDAPPDRVFHALIDPDALNHWIASAAVVEPRVGGRYTYGWECQIGDRTVFGGPQRILDLVPNERLVTDWPDWRGDPSKPATRVAWLLERVGDKTRVTVIHGRFPRVVDISDYPFGWAQFLHALKGVVEK